jgi:hypothetical protein
LYTIYVYKTRRIYELIHNLDYIYRFNGFIHNLNYIDLIELY